LELVDKLKTNSYGLEYTIKQGQVGYISYIQSKETLENDTIEEYRVSFLEKKNLEQSKKATFNETDDWGQNDGSIFFDEHIYYKHELLPLIEKYPVQNPIRAEYSKCISRSYNIVQEIGNGAESEELNTELNDYSDKLLTKFSQVGTINQHEYYNPGQVGTVTVDHYNETPAVCTIHIFAGQVAIILHNQ